jgi:hypothetical protein
MTGTLVEIAETGALALLHQDILELKELIKEADALLKQKGKNSPEYQKAEQEFIDRYNEYLNKNNSKNYSLGGQNE